MREGPRLQPAAPRFPWMPGGPPKAPEKPADTHRGGFGMEFPWTRGELTLAGQTFAIQALWSNEANAGQGACAVTR